MSRYLIATLEVKLSELPRFVQVMGRMQALLTAAGWRLEGSYSLRTGLAGTVVNIWELADLEQVDVGFRALALSPDWPQIQASLAELVIRETVNFADALPYPVP